MRNTVRSLKTLCFVIALICGAACANVVGDSKTDGSTAEVAAQVGEKKITLQEIDEAAIAASVMPEHES